MNINILNKVLYQSVMCVVASLDEPVTPVGEFRWKHWPVPVRTDKCVISSTSNVVTLTGNTGAAWQERSLFQDRSENSDLQNKKKAAAATGGN